MRNFIAVLLCLVALNVSYHLNNWLGIVIGMLAGGILGGVAMRADRGDRIMAMIDDIEQDKQDLK